ncbi:hypothetical protein [Parasitella parasitica]|uniref:Uncharacterized protein n=1 Tax=Parasitella parasitica TaxID=35722 RepID=A0A0B7N233_9FUNG|nr:hypothetical protein [Parasitella parasitica]
MYQFNFNKPSPLMRRQSAIVRNRRLASSLHNQQVRQGGVSKGLVASLLVAAAAFAYYKRNADEQKFYRGDSDPYEKTKKSLSNIGDNVARSTEPKVRGAANEVDSAGKHIKESASLAGQAAQDAYNSVVSSAKKEGEQLSDSFKKETNELASEIDRFRQQHHLKEGDRTPEDVLSHKYNEVAGKVSSKASELKQDANEAAFNAADKFKGAKNSAANDHNPMVSEKASTGKTKSGYERGLESYSNDVVRDTSNLVSKDTDKVKKVWDDKAEQEKAANGDAKESKGFWSSLLGGSGASNEAAQHTTTLASKTSINPSTPRDQPEKQVFDTAPTNNGNPMVYEKRNFDKTKPGWETRLEDYAKENVHDTSTLVGKDTEKVRGVWEEKQVRDNGGHPVPQDGTGSFWSSLYGQAKDVEHKVEERLEEGWQDVKSKVGLSDQDAADTYQDAKDKASAETSRLGSKWNET